jgi:hypothetical protein
MATRSVDTIPNLRAQSPIPLPPPQREIPPGSAGNLRGIPVIGGAAGVIPGTSPHNDGAHNADRGRRSSAG